MQINDRILTLLLPSPTHPCNPKGRLHTANPIFIVRWFTLGIKGCEGFKHNFHPLNSW